MYTYTGEISAMSVESIGPITILWFVLHWYNQINKQTINNVGKYPTKEQFNPTKIVLLLIKLNTILNCWKN